MDDPNTRRSQPLTRSFDLNDELPVSTVNGRKRKLQYEEWILPLSKHRFHDRFCESDDDSSIEEISNAGEHRDVGTPNGRNDYTKKGEKSDCSMGSFGGSNRFVGMHDSNMTVDTGGRVTASFECASHRGQPSTPSGSCSNNGFGNSYSMESSSRNMNIADQGMFKLEDVKDESQLEKELGQYRQSLNEFEAFGDLSSSEIESIIIDNCIGGGSDDLLPYPNGLTSNTLARSLGDRPAAQKPTIDQEFEQYFSSLML